MNNWMTRCMPVLVMLLALMASFSQGANAATARLTGSYEVAGKSNLGPQVKVSLRLHFSVKNQEAGTLRLQKVILADFGHRPVGVASSVIALRAGTSEKLAQEFVIPRAEFEEWQRGVRPRVVLEFETAAGARVTQAVRLERVSAGKGE